MKRDTANGYFSQYILLRDAIEDNLDIAAQMVAGGKYEYTAMFLEAQDYAKFIFDGTVPMGVAGVRERPTQPSGPNPDYVGDDPPPPEDDDIGF